MEVLLFRLQLYDLFELKVQGDGNCQVSSFLYFLDTCNKICSLPLDRINTGLKVKYK